MTCRDVGGGKLRGEQGILKKRSGGDDRIGTGCGWR